MSNKIYELCWLGKEQVKAQIEAPLKTVLEEDKEFNSKEENLNSQNLLIQGDNLEVLKHLLKDYKEKIKMIYIDPPYNTKSKDLLYNDNRKHSLDEIKDLFNDSKEEVKQVKKKVDSASLIHSAWLSFMYPRLYITRQLLREDGFIFISIDDNEVAQLKLIMDEIYGEENFVSCSIVVNNRGGRNYGSIAKQHEYLIIYSKKSKNKLNWIVEEHKKFWGKDEIGEYNLIDLRNGNIKISKENRPNLFFPFYVNPNKQFSDGLYEISLEPKEGFIEVFPSISQGIQTVWRWGKKKALENLNKEIFAKKKKDGNYVIVKKYRRKDKMQKSVWDDKDFETQKGTSAIRDLFSFTAFNYPKAVAFIKRVIELGTSPQTNDIVLDFFAGSGTTGESVMELNVKDGGNRRFILVQLDEPVDPQRNKNIYDYLTNELKVSPNIFEIAKERLKKVIKKIEAEYNIKNGFKVCKLMNLNELVNMRIW